MVSLFLRRLARVMLLSCVTAFAISGTAPRTAQAAEPICLGGSRPRGDISWCSDFESFANPACQSGSELACAVANNIPLGISGTFAIKGGDAAVGSGAIEGRGEAGGTGPGYTNISLPGASTSASLRFYVKFKDGYLQSSWSRGNHGPAIEATDGSCFVRVTLDWYNGGPSFMTNGTCAPGGGSALPSNLVETVPMKNNRWYLVEMQSTLNTTAGSGTYSGNGVFRAWVDGVKVMEHTNLNIRGTSAATFRSINAARSYYAFGAPSWRPTIAYDNFAFSNNGTYIGAAAGENPRAPGDPKSPYITWGAFNAMVGRRAGSDCSVVSGELGETPNSVKWRGGSDALQSAVVHRQYVTSCPNAVEQAMLAAAPTGNGAGLAHEFRTDPGVDRLVLHGAIYLPSTNDFNANTPLAGLARYGTSPFGGLNNWGQQVALTVSGGKWAILQQTAGGVYLHPTSTAARFNAWHEFEIHVSALNRVSLMMDRIWLFDEAPLTQSVAWVFDNDAAGPRHFVLGVIDHRGVGTYQAYYDDTDLGTASFWSCKGWSSESCPFGGGFDSGPARPSAPTGVTVAPVI